MSRVVEIPVSVQQASLPFQLAEKWRARIGGQNVKGRALQSMLFHPVDGSFEYLRAIMIEAEDKAAVDLNPMIVKQVDSTPVLTGKGTFLACFPNVVRTERLESYEDSGTPGERHFPDQTGVVRDVDADGRTPDDL